MRKKMTAFLLVICILVTTSPLAGARASDYLERYAIQLRAGGSGSMTINMSVDGTGPMSRVGVQKVVIDEKNSSTGTWHTYETWAGADDPDLYYATDAWFYMHTHYFDGTPGKYYRVTITAHAVLNGSGSDTGTVTSTTVLCT